MQRGKRRRVERGAKEERGGREKEERGREKPEKEIEKPGKREPSEIRRRKRNESQGEDEAER
jgi:hypothetical protein